ncbi:MAG: helix-hairpin-helix domain-containing protein [Acidobacteria bacterium]|nr:helix-hairpin-helix domain-containing protein [Acidobacteriota bacterium]
MKGFLLPTTCALMLIVQATARGAPSTSLRAGAAPAGGAQGEGPLPDAPGKELVEIKCGSCHGIDYLAPSTRTVAQWRDTIAVMKNSGANASDEEWKTVTEYLMGNLAYLNVNKASADDVRLVFGVPEKVAQGIVAARDTQGGFTSIDDLKQFPDLDQKKIEAMKARLSF